ncbi:MAG: hypothetical protein KDA87_20505 [Planctomycetales bacterium]|nr:hypothetical protein [Planctomycetales bacterium]
MTALDEFTKYLVVIKFALTNGLLGLDKVRRLIDAAIDESESPEPWLIDACLADKKETVYILSQIPTRTQTTQYDVGILLAMLYRALHSGEIGVDEARLVFFDLYYSLEAGVQKHFYVLSGDLSYLFEFPEYETDVELLRSPFLGILAPYSHLLPSWAE